MERPEADVRLEEFVSNADATSLRSSLQRQRVGDHRAHAAQASLWYTLCHWLWPIRSALLTDASPLDEVRAAVLATPALQFAHELAEIPAERRPKSPFAEAAFAYLRTVYALSDRAIDALLEREVGRGPSDAGDGPFRLLTDALLMSADPATARYVLLSEDYPAALAENDTRVATRAFLSLLWRGERPTWSKALVGGIAVDSWRRFRYAEGGRTAGESAPSVLLELLELSDARPALLLAGLQSRLSPLVQALLLPAQYAAALAPFDPSEWLAIEEEPRLVILARALLDSQPLTQQGATSAEKVWRTATEARARVETRARAIETNRFAWLPALDRSVPRATEPVDWASLVARTAREGGPFARSTRESLLKILAQQEVDAKVVAQPLRALATSLTNVEIPEGAKTVLQAVADRYMRLANQTSVDADLLDTLNDSILPLLYRDRSLVLSRAVDGSDTPRDATDASTRGVLWAHTSSSVRGVTTPGWTLFVVGVEWTGVIYATVQPGKRADFHPAWHRLTAGVVPENLKQFDVMQAFGGGGTVGVRGAQSFAWMLACLWTFDMLRAGVAPERTLALLEATGDGRRGLFEYLWRGYGLSLFSRVSRLDSRQ